MARARVPCLCAAGDRWSAQADQDSDRQGCQTQVTVAQSFYTFLSTQPGIPAAFFPLRLPLNHEGFPALTFNVSDDADIPLLDGGVSSAHTALIDVDCWAKNSLIQAETLATAVKAALFPGGVSYVGPFGSIDVDMIIKTREFHSEEPDTRLVRISLQFEVSYG